MPEALRIYKLALGANEGFYFHGTDQSTADIIAHLGFDERFSKGIYADGLCFSPVPQRSPTHMVSCDTTAVAVRALVFHEGFDILASQPDKHNRI